MGGCLWRLEGVRTPVAGLIGGCKPLSTGAGLRTELESSIRAQVLLLLNHLTHIPIHP